MERVRETRGAKADSQLDRRGYRKKYTSSQKTEKLTDTTWTFNHRDRYDSGSVEGSVIKESMVIGGMAVKKVEMGLVKRQGQRIQGFKADGIVGLAFPSISTTQNTSPSQHSTFVQLLQEQFGGTGDLFSVYLTRESYGLTPQKKQLYTLGATCVFGLFALHSCVCGRPTMLSRHTLLVRRGSAT